MKDFPLRCPECGEAAVYPVVGPYTTKFKIRGVMRDVTIDNATTHVCRKCGSCSLPNALLNQLETVVEGLRDGVE